MIRALTFTMLSAVLTIITAAALVLPYFIGVAIAN